MTETKKEMPNLGWILKQLHFLMVMLIAMFSLSLIYRYLMGEDDQKALVIGIFGFCYLGVRLTWDWLHFKKEKATFYEETQIP